MFRPISCLLPKMTKRLPLYSFLAAIGLLVGFFRELVVAQEFGLSAELDVYIAILGVHTFFGVQVGNALESVFVSKVAKSDGGRNVVAYFAPALKSVILANFLIVFLLLLLSDTAISAIFSEFDSEQHKLAMNMLRWLLATIALANISGMIRAGLIVCGEFVPGFISGAVISVATILSILAFSHLYGVYAILYGFVAGNLLVTVYFSYRLYYALGKFPRILSPEDGVRKPKLFYLWGASLVVLVGEILFQASSMAERSFASSIQVGTISSFFYASTLLMVPVSLVVMPLTTVVYPRMVKAFHDGKLQGTQLLCRAGSFVLAFSVIATALLVGFSDLLVGKLFVRGNFTMEDAARTADALTLLALALPSLSASRLLTYSFYALSDYRSPVIGRFINFVTLIAVAGVLVPALGAKGLAIAVVAAVTLATVVMLVLLVGKLRYA